MDKLTIEEKAKRYDELSKEVKDFFDGKQKMYSDVGQTLSYLFPEFRDSEDENIRKELISFLQLPHPQFVGERKQERWLAWLEKQGEKKPVTEGTFVNVDEVREDFMQEVYRVLNADPTNDRANQIIDAFDHLPTIIIQKPIDKIQLGKKYKCIASPRYSTFMIGQIYKPEDEFLCSLMNFCSDCFKPIEDGEQKLIFNAEHWYVSKVDGQIHDMTYNSADNFEPKFKVGDTIRLKNSNVEYIIESISDSHYYGKGFSISIVGGNRDYELVEQKPAKWSKEDELHIRELESLVKQAWVTADSENDKETIHKMSDLAFFLKTLKPQLKREWSKEDEEMIEGLNNCLDELEEDNGWYYVYVNNKNIKLYKIRNWLKSLKPQKHITDEELTQAKKNAYNDALDKIEYHSGEPTFDDGWSAAIKYLYTED